MKEVKTSYAAWHLFVAWSANIQMKGTVPKRLDICHFKQHSQLLFFI